MKNDWRMMYALVDGYFLSPLEYLLSLAQQDERNLFNVFLNPGSTDISAISRNLVMTHAYLSFVILCFFFFFFLILL